MTSATGSAPPFTACQQLNSKGNKRETRNKPPALWHSQHLLKNRAALLLKLDIWHAIILLGMLHLQSRQYMNTHANNCGSEVEISCCRLCFQPTRVCFSACNMWNILYANGHLRLEKYLMCLSDCCVFNDGIHWHRCVFEWFSLPCKWTLASKNYFNRVCTTIYSTFLRTKPGSSVLLYNLKSSLSFAPLT